MTTTTKNTQLLCIHREGSLHVHEANLGESITVEYAAVESEDPTKRCLRINHFESDITDEKLQTAILAVALYKLDQQQNPLARVSTQYDADLFDVLPVELQDKVLVNDEFLTLPLECVLEWDAWLFDNEVAFRF